MKDQKNDSTQVLARFGRDKRVRVVKATAERVERHLLDRVGREVELRLCGLDSHVGHNGSAFIGFVKMKKAPCIQRLT